MREYKPYHTECLAVGANAYQRANYNRIIGNIIYGLDYWAYLDSSKNMCIEGNRFINNVAINNTYGFFQRADANLVIENMIFWMPKKQNLY